VQKKCCLLILAFVFMLLTTIMPLSSVKAPVDEVRFYVYPHIIPAVAPGGYVNFEIWIESPILWEDTGMGIVGYVLSVRGDPRALEPVGAGKIPAQSGFLEDFALRHGRETGFFYGEIDTVTCTFFDISELIQGYETLGVGAGGIGRLCRVRFRARSDVIPSVIDIFGPSGPPIVEIHAQYLTADGVWHDVDVEDDGAYIAQTPATMYFDSSPGYDPTTPMGSDWHELWPAMCNWWSLESWEDNDDGALSESDQIDLVQTDGPHPGVVVWGHVVWVNPVPTAGDAKADLIIEAKVPEFPLGIGLLMVLAPAIPILYLLGRRRKFSLPLRFQQLSWTRALARRR